MHKNNLDYRSSGVDIRAGEEAINSIRQMVKTTYNNNVLSELGSFGGLYRFDGSSYNEPILVSSTDGVGTKLRVAIQAQRFDTVGQDLVNHCVNDILVQGAEPLFFLDYIGLGKMNPEQVKIIISGMVKACQENGCALIGGEMAEMPGFYQEGDFDLVGTIVGAVDRSSLLPRNIQVGDLIIGIPSSGLHTNGYSLVRKIIFERLKLNIDSYVPELNSTVEDALLSIHKSYLPLLRPVLSKHYLHGLAHITGGGIPGNLKRIIPDGLAAYINYGIKDIPPLFHWLQTSGNLNWEVMLETFNLGIGMIAVIEDKFKDEFMSIVSSKVIGYIDKSLNNKEKVIIS
jgi:phosphoribosylformylglycinamidine cyclo-ligase